MSTVMLSEATEVMMAERRGRLKDRPAYKCHGICERMLRPWRRSVAQFPGTAMEYSANRCVGCWHLWMREMEPENPLYALSHCSAGCGTITRPEREPLANAPHTLRRPKNDSRCWTCAGPGNSEKTLEHTKAGLDRFMSTMRANAAGVKARGWS